MWVCERNGIESAQAQNICECRGNTWLIVYNKYPNLIAFHRELLRRTFRGTTCVALSSGLPLRMPIFG